MFNPMEMLISKLCQQNPNVANTPRAQAMLDVIRSGDANRGQQIAQNICKEYGMTPQQMMDEAKKRFGF